jgi:hypothetical protein
MSIRGLRGALAIALGALLLLALGTGCSFQRQRVNIENPYARLARVKPGETRAEELTAILGTAPSSKVPVPPDKEGFVYGFGDSKTFMLGIIILNFQKTNTGMDTAVVVIDKSGIVQDVIHSTNSKDLPWQFWPFGGE